MLLLADVHQQWLYITTMAEPFPVEVRQPEGLTEALYDLGPGDRIPLLGEYNLMSPISSIQSDVSLASYSATDYPLEITTRVVLQQCPPSMKKFCTDTWSILKSSRRGLDGMRAGFGRMAGSSDEDPLVFRDSERSNHTRGLIVPEYRGIEWVAQTMLGAYEYDGEAGQHDVDRFVDVSVMTLNSLIRAAYLNCEVGQRLAVTPRIFDLHVTRPDDAIWVPVEAIAVSETVDDIFARYVGIDGVIKELRDMVKLANKPPELLEQLKIQPAQSVIFYGPSGTGKSDMIKDLARALGAEVMPVSFKKATGKSVSEWGQSLEAIFDQAFAQEGRVLIAFDEMEGFLNSGNPEVTDNITAVMKLKLEELRQHPNVFFAGATNEIDKINPVILADKRMHIKLELRAPSPDVRARVFSSLLVKPRLEGLDFEEGDEQGSMAALAKMEALDHLDQAFMEELAALTDGFSAGDIVEIVAYINSRLALEFDDSIEGLPIPTRERVLEAVQRAKNSHKH